MSYPVRRAARYPRTPGWWDPLAEIAAVHRRLDQLFFGAPSAPWGHEEANDVDVEETDQGWVVEAQLPGVPADDIHVDLADRELSIRGATGPPDSDHDSHAGRTRGRRQYTYRLTLPGEVDADRVTANLENGLLTVTLPASPRAAGKKIQVGTGATGTTEAIPATAAPAETGMATYHQPGGGATYQATEAQGRYPMPGSEQHPLPDQPPPNYGYEAYPQPEQPYQQPYQRPERPHQAWPEQARGGDDQRDQPT